MKFDVQTDAGLAAPPSSLENDFYSDITKVAAQEFGGAPVLPYQSPWATDLAQLWLHNVQIVWVVAVSADGGGFAADARE